MHKIIITIFAILFSLTMLRSGWVTQEGLRLIGVNSSDGLWNLALIEELKNHFPPDHPAFAGLPLKAYHFLYHLTLAITSKLTGISAITLYFHIAPILISLAWGFGVYFFVLERFKSNKAALWSVFLSFFGGSFAWIFHFLGYTKLSLDSAFGIAQPFGSSQVNPAFASSIVLVVWSLIGLQRYLKTKRVGWLILMIVFSGISVGFKTYAGMILMGAFVASAIWELIIRKKIALTVGFITSFFISIIVFIPFSGNFGFLTYAPLWPLHRLMQGTLNFTRWDELWEIYQNNQNWVGWAKLELWALTFFFFGNIGLRVIAFIPVMRCLLNAKKSAAKKLATISTIDIYITVLIFTSFFIPLFFLQPTGGGFNMIQMYWYFLFLLSLVAGYGLVTISSSIHNKILRFVIAFFFIAVNIPSNVSAFSGYLQSSGSYIDHDSLALFSTLREIPGYDKTVLTTPSLDDYSYASLNDWFARSNPIIPALAGKRAYIADEVVSFAYEDKERRLKIIEQFMKPQEICAIETFEDEVCQQTLVKSSSLLKQENIYLILSEQPIWWLDNWDKVRVLWSNPKGVIYEVLPL